MTRYQPAFLSTAEADKLFSWMQTHISWQTETIRLYGKTHQVPRLIAWVGEDGLNYQYSGKPHIGEGWPPQLHELRSRVSVLLGDTPNYLLLNRYRDGSDGMGWHRDDESGHGVTIASLSLGATRRFLIREEGADRSQSLTLANGSLLLFDGRVRHALPKTRRPVGERINLTFRVLQ